MNYSLRLGEENEMKKVKPVLFFKCQHLVEDFPSDEYVKQLSVACFFISEIRSISDVLHLHYR